MKFEQYIKVAHDQYNDILFDIKTGKQAGYLDKADDYYYELKAVNRGIKALACEDLALNAQQYVEIAKCCAEYEKCILAQYSKIVRG